MSMGERLRELRLKRNLSQEEVARHIGITRSAYSHYEINNRQPVYDTLIKLASFFNVSLDYIIGGSEPNQTLEATECSEVASDSKEILKLIQDMSREQRRQSIGLLHNMIRQEKRS